MPASDWVHLAQYDTAYGPLSYQLQAENIQDPPQATDKDPLIGYLTVKNTKIPILAQRDPAKLPWKQFKPDVVLECTGAFRTESQARQHLKAGAKFVVVSAPAKGGNLPTSVIGVNQKQLHTRSPNTVSLINNASCTTNCVAPVAKVVHSKLEITKAMLTTVHGYTDSQNLQDGSHKDLRRARAAALNIVPTSTGAAQATTQTIPQLRGLFDGLAIRVPVITGSITDFTFLTNQTTSVDQVNQIFIDAAHHPLYKGVLAVTNKPLVSSDIIGRPESAIVDLSMTRVVDGDLVKILAWYDNEWAYANRLVEQALQSQSE